MTLTLLFDLDDTLLDSNIEALVPVYFKKLAAHLADMVPPEKMLNELMRATLGMYASTQTDRTLEQVFNEMFYPALGTTPQALAGRIEQFYDEIFPTLQPLTRPRPAAVELVEMALARGWQVTVATDPLFPRKAILHRLRWANLAPERIPFGLVSDFQTFHFAKASVAFFAEFLGLLSWKEGPVLMIGDSLERDIIPARKAGLPAYWLAIDGQELPPEIADVPHGTLADLRRYLENVDLATLKPDFSSPSAMIGALQATPAVLHALIRTIDPARWAQRPAPGEWSFTEILCHLRDVDAEVNLPRIQTVLQAENAFIAGQNTDPWADERKYIQQDGARAFRDFVAARTHLVECLQSISAADWQRSARHTIFGPTHLSELVGFMVEHDRVHIQQAQASVS